MRTPFITPGFDAEKPGIVLLDIAAVFPSISHGYLFAVLEAMGFLVFFVHAVRQLYKNNRCVFIRNGQQQPGLLILSGIRQGCPASGSLFALAFDPFLCMLVAKLPHPRHVVRAFADDVAIVRALLQALGPIWKAFRLLASASCMELKIKKCVLIPLCEGGLFHTKRFLVDVLPELSAMSVALAGRYLGVMVGPEGDEMRWESPLAKFSKCVLQARAGCGGFFGMLRLYCVFAFSTLPYLLQFCSPPKDILKAETRAIQLLTAGPGRPCRKICCNRYVG